MFGVIRILLVVGLLTGLGLLAPSCRAAVEPLELNSQQRAWLDQHRQLRVGVVMQAPFAQFDQRLQQLSGLNVELMSWLASALQVELQWQQYPDQAALDTAVRQGRVDLAPGLSQTPAGLRLWLYSDPYMRVPQLLVGARNGGGRRGLGAARSGRAGGGAHAQRGGRLSARHIYKSQFAGRQR